MNERIKALIELAEYQAGKDSYSDWEVYVEPSRDQILEKFAELIVRECANITLDYKNHDHYTGWLDHGEEIARHFGVER